MAKYEKYPQDEDYAAHFKVRRWTAEFLRASGRTTDLANYIHLDSFDEEARVTIPANQPTSAIASRRQFLTGVAKIATGMVLGEGIVGGVGFASY